ncbi:MAG TPA: LamG domain-containing protein, partial [Bacteroidales bacterium]|nr:LamG domain-containing protein [Bacteroidales bacterium]
MRNFTRSLQAVFVFSALLSSLTGFSQQLPELLYYKFDSPGTTVANLATSPVGSNPATITGTTLTIGGTGQFGTGLVGTGGSSSSNVINTGWLTNLNSSFTIAFWTSGITPSSTLWYIFGDAGATTFRCFTNGAAGANNWMIRGGGLPDLTITGAATTSPNMVHYVYDAVAAQVRGYINGVQIATANVTSVINMAGTGFQIGGYGSNTGLSGVIDEFRIYNRALTPAEITTTWNTPLGAPVALDAGAWQITAPVSPISPGLEQVKLSIRNFGTDTLNSATLGWSVNGVAQTSQSWTGPLYPGDVDTGNVLGSYNFPLGTHTIKAWTSLPNGMADTVNFNDTVTASITCANVLNGVYYIGGAGADFPTINAAVTAAIAAGVSGPVTFNINSGTYVEQVNIPPILGTSSTNTITFQSTSGYASDVTIRYNASSTANYTLQLNGADYLNFSNLTFEAQDSTYARVVVFANSVNNVSFEGCVFTSQPMARSNSNSACLYDNALTDNNITIVNCEFWNGYYGVYSYGVSATPQTWVFTNNIVKDFYYYGLYFYYHNNTIMNENTVESFPAATVYAFNCYYCDGELEVMKNRVHAQGSGTLYGMRVAYADASYGAEGKVINNMITVSGTSTAANYGAYWYTNTYQVYHNNSILMAAGSTSGRAAYIYNGANSYASNNIYANTSGGYTVYYYGSPLVTSDYNNYYSTGSALAYWGSGNVANLAALQTASGMDANALSLDPLFMAPGQLYPGSVGMDDMGTPVALVTDDIDGNPRDAVTPDMGCVEYTPPQNDAGIISIDQPGSPL